MARQPPDGQGVPHPHTPSPTPDAPPVVDPAASPARPTPLPALPASLTLDEATTAHRHAWHTTLRAWPCRLHDGAPTVPVSRVVEALVARLSQRTDTVQACDAWIGGSGARRQYRLDSGPGVHDLDPVLRVAFDPTTKPEAVARVVHEAVGDVLPGLRVERLRHTEGGPVFLVKIPSLPGEPCIDLRIMDSNAYGYDFTCNALLASFSDPHHFTAMPHADVDQCLEDIAQRVFRLDHPVHHGLPRACSMLVKGFVPADRDAGALLEQFLADVSADQGLTAETSDETRRQILRYEINVAFNKALSVVGPFERRGRRVYLTPEHIALVANGIALLEHTPNSEVRGLWLAHLRKQLRDMGPPLPDPATTAALRCLESRGARPLQRLAALWGTAVEGSEAARVERGDDEVFPCHRLHLSGVEGPIVLPRLDASARLEPAADLPGSLLRAPLDDLSAATLVAGPGLEALWPKTSTEAEAEA
ncbi:MAG TPA: hypothetical protein VFH51_05445, partial [Myxococcota bacterium]|nr:hypothetical protein [Myxococcota bacterium]